jgi:hypothetical protein
MKKFKAVKDNTWYYKINIGDVLVRYNTGDYGFEDAEKQLPPPFKEGFINLLYEAGYLEVIPEPKTIKLEVEFKFAPRMREWYFSLNNDCHIFIEDIKAHNYLNSLLEKAEPYFKDEVLLPSEKIDEFVMGDDVSGISEQLTKQFIPGNRYLIKFKNYISFHAVWNGTYFKDRLGLIKPESVEVISEAGNE